MQTPLPPLRIGQIFMKDAEYAETKQKSYFRFLFFKLWGKFIENWPFFEGKNDHNSRDKNLNIDFYSL